MCRNSFANGRTGASTVPAFFERQQALIDGATAAAIPIIQIFHVEEHGPFSEASGLVATLAPIALLASAVFRKRRHSALISTGLEVWLTRNGIRRVIISGIGTEQCCETTTRLAAVRRRQPAMTGVTGVTPRPA
jgi:nicotinamidase-related amidase